MYVFVSIHKQNLDISFIDFRVGFIIHVVHVRYKMRWIVTSDMFVCFWIIITALFVVLWMDASRVQFNLLVN